MLKNKKFNKKNIVKKSELKHIIRESIKDIMNEQMNPCVINSLSSNSCDNGCDSPKSQQAMSFWNQHIYGPSLNNPVGIGTINQTFMNKLENMNCEKKSQLRQTVIGKLRSKQSKPNQQMCNGENPMHQAYLMLKMVVIGRNMYQNSCPQHPNV